MIETNPEESVSYSIGEEENSSNGLEKLVIIGCSSGGKKAVESLVPEIELGSSAVVVVPHIQNKEIYESLRELGVNAVGIGDEVELREGGIYVVDHTYPGLLHYFHRILHCQQHFLLKNYCIRSIMPTKSGKQNISF